MHKHDMTPLGGFAVECPSCGFSGVFDSLPWDGYRCPACDLTVQDVMSSSLSQRGLLDTKPSHVPVAHWSLLQKRARAHMRAVSTML